MEIVGHLSVWALAAFIFVLRIMDVSIGTVRTLAIVEGRLRLAMVLGFFEVLIWITVVAQVIARIHESSVLLVAFAGGFAAGNAAGIALERALAIGTAILRVISARGDAIASRFREAGETVTECPGGGRDGPVTMVFTACSRRRVRELVAAAREIDPRVVFSVERAGGWSHSRTVIANPRRAGAPSGKRSDWRHGWPRLRCGAGGSNPTRGVALRPVVI